MVEKQQHQQQESPDDLLSVKAAAKRANVSPKTVQRLVLSKRLPCHFITPKLWRIRRGSLEYFLAKHEIKAAS